MNQRSKRFLLDLLLASVLAVLLGLGQEYLLADLISPFPLALSVGPLIWLSLRYGPASGIVAAFITGLALIATLPSSLTKFEQVVYYILPLLTAGLAGLFARNTQRTLNNLRYASTYLNIYTASFLVVLSNSLLNHWLLPSLLAEPEIYSVTSWHFWLGIFLSALLWGSVLSCLAKLTPSLMIPKRSRFLSRKETTSLLN
ncbi:energy-coupled thiamine transporter ThiT [Hutsoniella sourekii]